MCELCSEETRKMARDGHGMRAEDLERMAAMERNIAAGRILPHTDDMKQVTYLAKALIRYLVEDYL